MLQKFLHLGVFSCLKTLKNQLWSCSWAPNFFSMKENILRFHSGENWSVAKLIKLSFQRKSEKKWKCFFHVAEISVFGGVFLSKSLEKPTLTMFLGSNCFLNEKKHPSFSFWRKLECRKAYKALFSTKKWKMVKNSCFNGEEISAFRGCFHAQRR